MNTLANKYQVEKTQNDVEFYKDSHFELKLKDNSILHEESANWSDIAESVDVKHPVFGSKRVKALKLDAKEITIRHAGLELNLKIDSKSSVYQAIQCEILMLPNGKRLDSTIGRVVGIIRNGTIVEEYYLNEKTKEITGSKYVVS